MRIVDTRGERCPKPIIETKKAIRETEQGERIRILTDNRTSYKNISRFLNDNGLSFTVEENDGVWTFELSNENSGISLTRAEDYCEIPLGNTTAGNYAVAVSSEIMGQGDDNLGRRLMKSFFDALSCLDNLPSVIVFYNAGVKLVEEGSEVVDILREMEKKGVEIILCGTCVDHFRLEGRYGAGRSGDMFQIMQKLSSSSNVIRP